MKSATKTTAKPGATREPPRRNAPQREDQEERRPTTPARRPTAETRGDGNQGRREDRASVPAVRDAETQPANIVQNMPTYGREYVGKGAEGIGQADMDVPRIKLIQGISPELQEYNDLRAGNFFHTATETIFDEPFLGIAIFRDCRYILWNPRDNGGGILARADDGVHWQPANAKFDVKLDKKDGGHSVTWKTSDTVARSGLADWGSQNRDDPNSPPAATKMYNFLLGFPEYPDLMPAVLTFQRSAIKMGRKFNTKLKVARAPIFAMVFKFESFIDTNSRGQDFHNVRASGAGFIEKTDPMFREYEKIHDGFAAAGLNIKDVEGLQDEDAGNNENDDGDNGGEQTDRRGGGGKPNY